MQKIPLKTVKSIFISALIVGALIAMYGALIAYTAMMVVGFVILFFSLVFNLVFFRCPHCGRHLGRDHGPYCQHCGKETGLK